MISIARDRKSTRLNSSHTEIYTLSLHDALPIYGNGKIHVAVEAKVSDRARVEPALVRLELVDDLHRPRSEEHTSELQSHRDLHSFPTRRSSDLWQWQDPCRR